jgi:serine/threonine protein phosphatase PrpC
MIRAFMRLLKKMMILKKKNEADVTIRTIKSGEATRVLQPAYTVRLRPEENAQTTDQKGKAAGQPRVRLDFTWAALTDIGRTRDHNEDNYAHLRIGEKSFFVVADGMGGHDAGEIASRIAVESACEEVRKGADTDLDRQGLVERAVQRANTEVKREGTFRHSNMGTTISAALVADGIAHIANVGDSRAYWIENGSITQITEDHSLVAKLVAAGKLSREESRGHPRSNILFRTIGSEDRVPVDTFRVALKKGGVLLLCSDGLWGEVSDQAIHRIVSETRDAKTICSRLVQTANENGGKDNITAIVVRVA